MADVTFKVGDYVVLNGMYIIGMGNRWEIKAIIEPNDATYEEEKKKVGAEVSDNETLYKVKEAHPMIQW